MYLKPVPWGDQRRVKKISDLTDRHIIFTKYIASRAYQTTISFTILFSTIVGNQTLVKNIPLHIIFNIANLTLSLK